jgi:hypothetical protein
VVEVQRMYRIRSSRSMVKGRKTSSSRSARREDLIRSRRSALSSGARRIPDLGLDLNEYLLSSSLDVCARHSLEIIQLHEQQLQSSPRFSCISMEVAFLNPHGIVEGPFTCSSALHWVRKPEFCFPNHFSALVVWNGCVPSDRS